MDELEIVYRKSEELVEREIEGELIIVPLTSGIADMEDELYTLNPVGRDVWERLNAKRSVGNIVEELLELYQGEKEEIRADVLGFLAELKKRRMIEEVKD